MHFLLNLWGCSEDKPQQSLTHRLLLLRHLERKAPRMLPYLCNVNWVSGSLDWETEWTPTRTLTPVYCTKHFYDGTGFVVLLPSRSFLLNRTRHARCPPYWHQSADKYAQSLILLSIMVTLLYHLQQQQKNFVLSWACLGLATKYFWNEKFGPVHTMMTCRRNRHLTQITRKLSTI